MSPMLLSVVLLAAGPQISFPQSAVVTEQIALRWMHIVAGIIWIGTLYFNNLVATPTLKGLEAPVRAKILSGADVARDVVVPLVCAGHGDRRAALLLDDPRR